MSINKNNATKSENKKDSTFENKNSKKNSTKKKLIIIYIIAFVLLLLFFLYRYHTQKNNLVTFNSNGGTFVEYQVVKTGEKVIEPPIPEKNGYVFIGWKLNNKTYDFSQKIQKDIVLDAVWKEKIENQVVIKFNSDGGTTIESQVITIGDTVKEPLPPIREGYVFVGWKTIAGDYNFFNKPTEDIELIAKWQKISDNKQEEVIPPKEEQKEPVKEPEKEEQKEPVKEPEKEEQKEPVKEPEKEEQKEPVKEPEKEEQKEPVKEPEKEEQEEPVKEPEKEEQKEPVKEPEKEEQKEPVKEPEKETPKIKNPNRKRNTIHFISTGVGDAILIESYGVFGLVDAANPYNDGTAVAYSDKSVTGEHVKEYLSSIGVKYLDFVVATHSHSDHIGGMVTVAKKYVNEYTDYFYRKFSGATDNKPEWDNRGYYNRAISAVKAKNANLVELTNKTPTYTYGNFKITFINTDSDNSINENNNSIGTIVQLGDKKIFLSSDIVSSDANKIASTIGKVDVLKLNHHGINGASYKYIKTLKPKYIVITNEAFVHAANAPVGYAKLNYGTKAYLTGNVSSAIRLNVTSSSCTFENTGGAVALNAERWVKWGSDYVFIENGKLKKGWIWDGSWYYLGSDGVMLRNTCSTIDGKKYCFNSSGALKS